MYYIKTASLLPGHVDLVQEDIRLVPVEAARGPNVSIERVTLPGTAVHRGETAQLSVFVRNTSLHYQLPKQSDVLLQVFDLSGRLVRTLVSAQPSMARL